VESLERALFEAAIDRLEAAGFEHYEVSNFARPGHQSRHNRSYWRGVPYWGFGPSAHGFDGVVRRWNRAAYVGWAKAIAGGADPVAGSEVIGDGEHSLERVYLGLRTTNGLEIEPEHVDQVRSWVAAGWATLSANRIVLTPLGWLRLDSLASTLTPVRGLR
jgi:oxygen-independent coproporphyrinogen-3 oxidase